MLEAQIDLPERQLERSQSARSRISEPGWCMPVSTSTIPEPAAIAHASQ